VPIKRQHLSDAELFCHDVDENVPYIPPGGVRQVRLWIDSDDVVHELTRYMWANHITFNLAVDVYNERVRDPLFRVRLLCRSTARGSLMQRTGSILTARPFCCLVAM
jgi:hypothetical protein